ncbi:MAG: cobalt-precorrin-6A reductase [Pseudomonadota bacterium]
MKILVLAGTAEARELCSKLQTRGHDVQASLAGETRKPLPIDVPMRIGGFGGITGLQSYLDDNQIELLIDATHPFASQMTAHAAKVVVDKHIVLQRPAWHPGNQDNWTFLNHAKEAAVIVRQGQKVLLATGRKTLNEFASLEHAYVYARVLDKPEGPYPYSGEYLWGRPPFSVEDEIALFKRLAIDWIVVKNAGGPNSASKLVAARALNIPVLMLRRPELPNVEVRKTVQEILEWIDEFE